LEQWIDATISKDGLAEQDLIARIKESYRRSLQANIVHHATLAKSLQATGEEKSSKRHALLANVYKALIE
jgi:hypothetical protein